MQIGWRFGPFLKSIKHTTCSQGVWKVSTPVRKRVPPAHLVWTINEVAHRHNERKIWYFTKWKQSNEATEQRVISVSQRIEWDSKNRAVINKRKRQFFKEYQQIKGRIIKKACNDWKWICAT